MKTSTQQSYLYISNAFLLVSEMVIHVLHVQRMQMLRMKSGVQRCEMLPMTAIELLSSRKSTNSLADAEKRDVIGFCCFVFNKVTLKLNYTVTFRAKETATKTLILPYHFYFFTFGEPKFWLDALLLEFLTCVQCISQIHLRCDTRWPTGKQMQMWCVTNCSNCVNIWATAMLHSLFSHLIVTGKHIINGGEGREFSQLLMLSPNTPKTQIYMFVGEVLIQLGGHVRFAILYILINWLWI